MNDSTKSCDGERDEHSDLIERIRRRKADPEYMGRLNRLLEDEAEVLDALARTD